MALTALAIPAGSVIFGVFTLTGLTTLKTLKLAGTFSDNIAASGCAALSKVDVSELTGLVTGKTWTFNGAALDAANVNAILAKWLEIATAGEFSSGTLNLAGGTNAAPTGQGIADEIALEALGITVTVTA